MERLKGKSVVITGGAGAIGLAAARQFLSEGARVCLVDLSADRLEAARLELNGGERVIMAQADVSDDQAVAGALARAMEQFGGIDAAIGAAGIEGPVKPMFQLSSDEFDGVMRVNARSAFLLVKHAGAHLIARGGGAIVLLTSVAGMSGVPGLGAYGASKHAVVGITRVAALELAGKKVRVNCVAPAPIDNRMMRSIESQAAPGRAEAARERNARANPMGRYGTNEEVAAALLFLASDDSAYINGAVIPVDGGILAG
jgi:NAD(P)-dependent dehydrogenase (short-subunit alcohol dehydrogenase family)